MSGWCGQERPAHKASQSLPVAFEQDKAVAISRRIFFFFCICHYVHAVYLTVEPNSSRSTGTASGTACTPALQRTSSGPGL